MNGIFEWISNNWGLIPLSLIAIGVVGVKFDDLYYSIYEIKEDLNKKDKMIQDLKYSNEFMDYQIRGIGSTLPKKATNIIGYCERIAKVNEANDKLQKRIDKSIEPSDKYELIDQLNMNVKYGKYIEKAMNESLEEYLNEQVVKEKKEGIIEGN